MHRMKNMSSMGLLRMRQWSSQIRKRRVTRGSSARHGLLLCETWRPHTGADEDYALSTGEGLQTFWWNAVPYPWTAGPGDEGKLTSRQGERSQMTWIFTIAAVRISLPPIVVLKLPIDAWNHATVEVLRFLLSGCQQNEQTKVGRAFSLLCCSRVCWSFQI